MKSELRRIYAAARDNLTQAERAAADEKILNIFLDNYLGFESYFVYNSFKSEAATGGIIRALLSAGKRVYLPRVEGRGIVCVPYGKTRRGAFGIYEPEGEPYTGPIDVTVTPLLAVDGRGYRLGYGGGYYDRFFEKNQAVRVGIGYAVQKTGESFAEEWDKPLNAFICERGITIYDG